jgi:GDP-mannose 6-dehydrogenase
VESGLIPLLEGASGKKAGRDFGVCMNPEFLREGTSIFDFHHPPMTVIGELDQRSGDAVAELYSSLDAPVLRTSLRVAEMVKYACNAFHALKITFANEIGNLCKRLGIDSHQVMNLFCRDTKLNLSPYYLKPGFAFGGSCLPKDLRALLRVAKENDLECPVLDSILRSNNQQIETAYRMIERTGSKKIGFVGLSFKPGSDDLRESATVELIEKLIGKGYEIRIYDREVALARIMGSNKKYIEFAIPHVSSLMVSTLDGVLQGAEVVVVAKHTEEVEDGLAGMAGDIKIVDLVRMWSERRSDGSYEGICW